MHSHKKLFQRLVRGHYDSGIGNVHQHRRRVTAEDKTRQQSSPCSRHSYDAAVKSMHRYISCNTSGCMHTDAHAHTAPTSTNKTQTNTHVCTYMHTYAHKKTDTYKHSHTHIHARTQSCAYTHSRANTHSHTHTSDITTPRLRHVS